MSGLVQVIGIFMLAELLMPLREIAILDVIDYNLLLTFLVVSGDTSSNASEVLNYLHIL